MIETGAQMFTIYHRVCTDPRSSDLRRCTPGGTSCSINALSVNITTATRFRGDVTFCKCKCPQGRYSNYPSVFKSFPKQYYLSPKGSVTLEELCFSLHWWKKRK